MTARRSEADTNNGTGHVGKKATYAREAPVADGATPSRRSTRKSANHSKTDTGKVRTEQMRQATPDNQARKSRARAQRVRGGGAS